MDLGGEESEGSFLPIGGHIRYGAYAKQESSYFPFFT
jgi:hypothetical protein